MTAQGPELIEKKISSLISGQFPDFYQEEGPTFIAFVKEYYKWLETQQGISVPIKRGTVTMATGSPEVRGRFTRFNEDFANGDYIAIYSDDVNYEIGQVGEVTNSTFLTLTSANSFTFSANNTRHGTVKTQLNPIHHARRLFEYDDVDKTTDDFLVFFKEKYLKNIQLTTQTNTRRLIKHALDIYRSKGTERSLNLLFRLVFGVPARVYYPATDLFTLSGGTWLVPRYLEISLTEYAAELAGKQIYGVTSGATAYAEAVVRKTVQGRLIDVVYISNIKGDFITGELINTKQFHVPNKRRPKIIGSLTELVVVDGGAAFAVGDLVDLVSARGDQGQARVVETSNSTGLSGFELSEGGYAYSNAVEVHISDTIVTIANVQLANVAAARQANAYFLFKDQITQPLANIEYISANGHFPAGTLVYTYDANDDVQGVGVVLDRLETNDTEGSLLIAVKSGNLEANSLYTTGNAVGAEQDNYTDKTATANVIAQTSNVEIGITSLESANFKTLERVYQIDQNGQEVANALFVSFVRNADGSGTLNLANLNGVFYSDFPVRTSQSNLVANLTSIQITVGLSNSVNDLVALRDNVLLSDASGANGTILRIVQSGSPSFSISPVREYEENISVNTDELADYADIELGALAYGFPALPSGNADSSMGDCLTSVSVNVGKLTTLTNINLGEGVQQAPIVRIYDPLTAPYQKQGVVLKIENATGTFVVGELIEQAFNGARGIVKFANSSHVAAERLRWEDSNNFVETISTPTKLTGALSTFQADVVEVQVDTSTLYLGTDAIVTPKFVVSNNAVRLVPVDSGFGYVDDELVSFSSPTNAETSNGMALVVLGTAGRGTGRYTDRGGFLSDQKKLFDGMYYQHLSYDIQSSVTLNKYEDMLKQLLHVIGTKYFGSLFHVTKKNKPITSPPAFKTAGVNIMEWDTGQNMEWDDPDALDVGWDV